MGVSLTAPGVRLDLIEHGAGVQRLWVDDAAGAPINVALGHPDVAGHRAHPTAYLGVTVGRYANRIGGARFDLDGVTHRLPANDGAACLHGGPGGWHARAWEVIERSDAHCTLALHSPDGDQGFPGAVDATVTYRVAGGAGGPRVDIEHRATTDAPTVVSMTNHTYVNLDGEGSGSIDRHRLVVHAEHYLPTDTGSIPLGPPAPVAGTPLDFRTPTALGAPMRAAHPHLLAGRGIDHNLVPTPSREAGGVRPVATLSSPDSGLAMTLVTDQPGLQVYTGNFLDGSIIGTSGRRYRQGDGIALEPQAFPDSPNRPDYPSTVLRPGETYLSRLGWHFHPTDPS